MTAKLLAVAVLAFWASAALQSNLASWALAVTTALTCACIVELVFESREARAFVLACTAAAVGLPYWAYRSQPTWLSYLTDLRLITPDEFVGTVLVLLIFMSLWWLSRRR